MASFLIAVISSQANWENPLLPAPNPVIYSYGEKEEHQMKPLIFGGSGAIGRAVAWDLAEDKDVESLGIVGRREEALIKIKKIHPSPNSRQLFISRLNKIPLIGIQPSYLSSVP